MGCRACSECQGLPFFSGTSEKIIEAADLNKLLVDPSNLPLPQEVDARHENWRKDIILKAEGLGLKFTHGVAAKLINIYLKAGFVCGGHHAHANVKALHPPIDNVLLDELFAKNIGDHRCVWNEAKIIRWSKLNSVQYQKIIDEIRNSMPNQALWEVEQYWRGYQ